MLEISESAHTMSFKLLWNQKLNDLDDIEKYPT